MLPDPLHPALVHLPLALAVLVPGFAALAFWAIARSHVPRRTWVAVVLMQALLVGSGWLAAEAGEDQEDRVERVVAEQHIETHEEAAELFLVLAALALLPIAGGLLDGGIGTTARAVGTVFALVVLGAAVQVGHTGGELVYTHGAAAAYTGGTGGTGKGGASAQAASSDDHEDYGEDEEYEDEYDDD